MNNVQHLNEEKFIKIKKVLIAIGCVSLIIGIGLFVSSFFIEVPEMGTQGWFEASKQQTTLRFLSFPFGLMIPLMTFFLAFRRGIMSFIMQQSMPVMQESMIKMASSTGAVAREITKGIKEGLNDDKTK